MIVRDESAVIERCLQSVRPFITHWLIHDSGSQDDTIDKVGRSLEGLPGEVKTRPFQDFAVARNALISEAQQVSDLVLMIDADEELRCLTAKISLPSGVDIGILDILHNNYTTRQPRLFRSSSPQTFQLPLYERLLDQDQATSLVEGLSLKHHMDGLRHQNDEQHTADHALLQTYLSNDNKNSAINLALGQNALRRNAPDQALGFFLEAIKQGMRPNDLWLANYLVGNIYLATDKPDDASRLFYSCLELDGARAEPALRLAEMHYSKHEFASARELCRPIIDIEPPQLADYFEPACYDYAARMLLAEATLRLDDIETANSALSPLSDNHRLPADTRARYMQLRNEASTTRALSPEQSTAAQLTQGQKPKLTVGMATYDDYDGVYFSVMSIVLFHQDIIDDIEILIVDNNPGSDHGAAVKSLCSRVSQAKYIEASEYKGTTIRERVFKEAASDFVVCMDCHVFLHAGAVSELIRYFEAHPDSEDLLHGPLFYDNHIDFSTHMTPVWNAGFFGIWGRDERGANMYGEPFEIPLQGMGLFACARKNWRGFSQRFRGFGGEEGYIHEKFRQQGGRVLCLPFLRWTHRFERPNGAKYTNRWEDRIRNYLIGWDELGLDITPILEHFSSKIGHAVTAASHARFRNEKNGPLWGVDSIASIVKSDDEWAALQIQLQAIAADSITLRLKTASEASDLLRVALEKRYSTVVIIDSTIQTSQYNHGQLSKTLTNAEQVSADIVVGGPFIIIKHTAFKAARDSYALHGTLSTGSLGELNSSAVLTYIDDVAKVKNPRNLE